ncbi:MAG: hypothetical protein NT023_04690, partial [Armatimonadetes bacterium]|nr:hypothetical protein [Armatimonadota bacterium]
MKNSINLARVLCTGLVIGSLASSAYAQSGTKSASGIEKSLAGIRILQSYKSVLARYGAPTRIFAADDVVEFAYALDAKGDKTGGIKGILDARQGGGGGGMAAMTGGGGAPGGGGMAGMMAGRMPQGMGGGAPGGPPANMMAGMMSGRMPAG